MQTQDKEIKVGDHKNDEEEGEGAGWLAMEIKHFVILSLQSITCCKEIKSFVTFSLSLPVNCCLSAFILSTVCSHDWSGVLALDLLKLCRHFGVVVLLGVVFGSLVVSPRDDSMDLLSSASLLI